MISQNKCAALAVTLFLAATFLAAWRLQSLLFLNYDVSWLMHAAGRMLAGGTYSKDFFETNPPLILYLLLPPVLLGKIFSLHPALLFRGYLFLLASLSLGLCAFFVKKIFLPQRPWLAAAFLAMLALDFLIVPCYEFGQRDHLMLILTMPYLLLVVARLEGQVFAPVFAVALGILAGLGFSIKPHFLLTPLLIEIYYALHTKNSRAGLRPEILAALGTLVLYGLSIFIFFPDYLFIVVPFSLRVYYSGVSHPWSILLFNGVAVFSVFPLLFYGLQFREKSQYILRTIFALALVGFLLAYLAQRMMHFYHLIPPFSLALLLLVVEFGLALSAVPRRWLEGGLAVLTGLVLFSVPAWIFANLYESSRAYKKLTLNRIADFLNQHAQQAPVYFFATASSYAFSTIDYTQARIAPRFNFLWMAAGLANQTRARQPKDREQQQRDKNFFMNMVADDLHQYQPRYIFIDLSEKKYRFKDTHFDYLRYFSENPKFREEWRHYHYVTTLEEKSLYQLGVYRRTGHHVAQSASRNDGRAV